MCDDSRRILAYVKNPGYLRQFSLCLVDAPGNRSNVYGEWLEWTFHGQGKYLSKSSKNITKKNLIVAGKPFDPMIPWDGIGLLNYCIAIIWKSLWKQNRE